MNRKGKDKRGVLKVTVRRYRETGLTKEIRGRERRAHLQFSVPAPLIVGKGIGS